MGFGWLAGDGQAGAPHAHASLVAVGQRAQRVGAPLTDAARIALAHPGGHRGDPPLQHGGVGGQQPPPQRGGVGVVITSADGQVTATRADLGAAQRGRVIAAHPHLDGLAQLVLRQRPPPGGAVGQRDVDQGQRLLILNQVGRPGDRRHDPRAQRAFAMPRGHRGQPITQCHRDAHLARRPPVTDISAAATSAAAESHGSNAHNARTSSSSTRRRTNSAIAASRRAAAVASARAPSSIAAISSASLGRRELRIEHTWRSTGFRGCFCAVQRRFRL